MPDLKPDLVAELDRDIAAARAALRGRCDQLTADYEVRLHQLAVLGRQLESGAIDSRAAELRVRQLLDDKRGLAAPTRAGRTVIGLAVPSRDLEAATERLPPRPLGIEAALAKAAQALEQRLVAVLAAPRAAHLRGEAKLELSLLAQLRRGVERQTAEPPVDPVVLAAAAELAEEVHRVLASLEAGGLTRIRALAEHVRGLVTQLSALGGGVPGAKEQLQRVRSGAVKEPAPALEDVLVAFTRVSRELERRYPAQASSLLDEILRA